MEYRNIRAYMAWHRLTVKETALRLNMSTTSLNNKLKGEVPWWLHEALDLKNLLNERGSNVTVEELFPQDVGLGQMEAIQ